MLIALRLARPQTLGLDPRFQRRQHPRLRIELQAPVDILEVTAYPRDHHVPDGKLGCRVSRLKNPSGHTTLLEFAQFGRSPTIYPCRITRSMERRRISLLYWGHSKCKSERGRCAPCFLGAHSR